MMRYVFTFLGCLALCYIAAGIGAAATMNDIPTWYATIYKPSFNPPNWIFGPVWTLLYSLMAISLFLIVITSDPRKYIAIGVFMAQLILNVLWSVIFFKFHLLGLATIEVLLFLASIIAYAVLVKPINVVAAYLFVPYIAWVSFASVLTASIWYLNLGGF